MNVSVKLEPGIIEDTNSLPDEFLDEKSDIPNVKTNKKLNDSSTSNKKSPKIGKVIRKRKNSTNIKTKIEPKSTATGEFTPYFRKQFLNLFLLEGCSPQTIAKYANIYNLKVEDINGKNVYTSCDNIH